MGVQSCSGNACRRRTWRPRCPRSSCPSQAGRSIVSRKSDASNLDAYLKEYVPLAQAAMKQAVGASWLRGKI